MLPMLCKLEPLFHLSVFRRKELCRIYKDKSKNIYVRNKKAKRNKLLENAIENNAGVLSFIFYFKFHKGRHKSLSLQRRDECTAAKYLVTETPARIPAN